MSKFYGNGAQFISVIREILLSFVLKYDYFSNAKIDFFVKV